MRAVSGEAAPAKSALTAAQTRELLHELQVHQVELELQNEELRRSEAGLVESRLRYFDLYHLAPVGYCTVDDDGRITEANLTLATLLRVDRSELLTQPFARFLDPVEANALHLMRQRLFANGEAQRLEVRLLRRDGSPFWGLLEAILAPDAVHPHACRITINDISTRRRVEENLRDREQRYHTLTDTAWDAIITTDQHGRILDTNPAAVRLFDYGMLELGNRPIEHLLPGLFPTPAEPSTGSGFAARADALVGHLVERTALRNGGAEFPVELSLARWVAGGARFYSFIIRDTSERELAQTQLRKLSRIVEQAPLAIVITDLHGIINYVNPHFCCQSGYAPAEVLGQNVGILKSGETKPEVYVELWATVRAGRVWRGEFISRSKDGRRMLESVTITPVVDALGRPVCYVSMKEDITHRREEAAARVELMNKLEEVVRLKALGGVAGGLAQEFSRLVGEIRAQTIALRAPSSAGPAAEPLQRIDEACGRAEALGAQLLACAGGFLPPRPAAATTAAAEAKDAAPRAPRPVSGE